MSLSEKLEHYFETQTTFKSALIRLREIIDGTELEENFKWRTPVYTINGKNVVGIGAFKNHFGLWFFNGALLKDEDNMLVNAQDGKTKALRQMRFTAESEIDEKIVTKYLKEAIENQKAGREIKSAAPVKKVIVPSELKNAFTKHQKLQTSFEALTPGRQKEYAEYISSAKQDDTRIRRLDKCIPMILAGVGLHDKYKNC